MEAKTNDEKQIKNYALIVYILYALSVVVGLTAIAGVIVAYLKKEEAVGTWIEKHFEYQIRTFWISLIVGAIGFLLSFIAIGVAVIIADIVWFIYRVIKGWIALNDEKPVDPQSWL